MAKLPAALVLAVLISAVAGCKQETPPAKAPAPAPQVQTPPPAAPAPSPAAVSVSNISLGKALGPDKKVTAATDSFDKGDTIYAVVETTGSGNATLKAKWTYHRGDKTATVDESAQTISATGSATNEFHISKPDGWPVGDYQVEIALNDKPVGTRKFVVK